MQYRNGNGLRGTHRWSGGIGCTEGHLIGSRFAVGGCPGKHPTGLVDDRPHGGQIGGAVAVGHRPPVHIVPGFQLNGEFLIFLDGLIGDGFQGRPAVARFTIDMGEAFHRDTDILPLPLLEDDEASGDIPVGLSAGDQLLLVFELHLQAQGNAQGRARFEKDIEGALLEGILEEAEGDLLVPIAVDILHLPQDGQPHIGKFPGLRFTEGLSGIGIVHDEFHTVDQLHIHCLREGYVQTYGGDFHRSGAAPHQTPGQYQSKVQPSSNPAVSLSHHLLLVDR